MHTSSGEGEGLVFWLRGRWELAEVWVVSEHAIQSGLCLVGALLVAKGFPFGRTNMNAVG